MSGPATPRRRREETQTIVSSTPSQKLKDSDALSNYTLGDCLGRGAHASVYRALNLATGETVAVKQINLDSIQSTDVASIMMEIDLLKNLNHPNIVKYHGFVKTHDTLSIILEYCENGSLSNICRRFGKFPEKLVAVYIYQVLQGLAYLHVQGTIHRDIKGANILTTKDGLAKLADFGVATKIAQLDDDSVVGTPNWMAPEVIEMNGATSASDIWSLGCTIVELLTGKPPYHNLQQMPALFAIVNDDHPPIPEGVSPVVKDFLLQCFQKDPNLRVSAKKLLKHPWMQSVDNSRNHVQTTAKYDDIVKSVQMWNSAIERPKPDSAVKSPLSFVSQKLDSPFKPMSDPFLSIRQFNQTKRSQLQLQSSTKKNNENWDDVFDDDIAENLHYLSIASPSPRQNNPRPLNVLGPDSPFRDDDTADYSQDLEGELKVEKLRMATKKSSRNFPQVLRPSDITNIRQESSFRQVTSLNAYSEAENAEDYSDLFDHAEQLQKSDPPLQIKPSRRRSHDDDNYGQDENDNNDVNDLSDRDDEDPFSAINGFEEDAGSGDFEANIERDRIAQAHQRVEALVEDLNGKDKELIEIATELTTLLSDLPELSKTLMRSHGLLSIVEILENDNEDAIIESLLRCLNLVMSQNHQAIENICLIGGIPVISRFATKSFPITIRCQAAEFVRIVCGSSNLNLQTFISCNGLAILIDLAEEDYLTHSVLVDHGVEGIWRIFQSQASVPRNDLSRMLSSSSVVESLAITLYDAAAAATTPDTQESNVPDMILSILFHFSQCDSYVKERIATRTIFRALFRSYPLLSSQNQLTLLKMVKNLSTIPSNFAVIQNSNVIETLVHIILQIRKSDSFKDFASQVLHTLFNLCRLNKSLQEEAAASGVIPLLQEVILKDLPMKQFALPILCEMPSAGKVCRKLLWQNDGLSTYLYLTSDLYWQVNAYDAIATWYLEEPATIEERLCQPSYVNRLLAGIDESKGDALNAVLESLEKILRASRKISAALPHDSLFTRAKRRLKTSRPIVKLNLLRVVRIVLDQYPPSTSAIKSTGLDKTIEMLAAPSSPVLVRELAKEILTIAEKPSRPMPRAPSFQKQDLLLRDCGTRRYSGLIASPRVGRRV